MERTIDIANEFSKVPAGRFLADGPFSGEAFREAHLRPALQASGEVVVLLDGGKGYGSSFLEEAFGGLARRGYFSYDELRLKLRLISADPTLIAEVWSYIERATPKKH